MKENVLKVAAVQCPTCLDIIYSRARHDNRRCSCGKYAIDGGRDYSRMSFPSGSDAPNIIELELVGITDTDLYRDWNFHTECFGRVKTVKVAYKELWRYTVNAKGKFYRYAK